MSSDMDKAIDFLMKLISSEDEESDNENYNEIAEEITEEDIEEDTSQMQNIFDSFAGNDDKRVTLLTSIKPYMNGKRQGKIDTAIQIVRFISLSSGLGITNLFKQ